MLNLCRLFDNFIIKYVKNNLYYLFKINKYYVAKKYQYNMYENYIKLFT